jgi:integrase
MTKPEKINGLAETRPWNKNRLVGQKRPLKSRDVWAIRTRLELNGNKRDLALFNLAIDSKLRACDLVSLKVCDIQTAERIRERASIVQKKTGRPVQFELTETTRLALTDWLGEGPCLSVGYLFPSRIDSSDHLSTRQYARLVHKWIALSGLNGTSYDTHSMRRTKVVQIYRKTGNLRAVQLLLGHTKLETTVRYLGIEVEDALTMSEQLEI